MNYAHENFEFDSSCHKIQPPVEIFKLNAQTRNHQYANCSELKHGADNPSNKLKLSSLSIEREYKCMELQFTSQLVLIDS